MGYKRKVDDRVFNGVKTLLRSGASQREVASYMQVSGWTVSMIGRSETLEEYRHIIEQRKLERKKEREKKSEPVPEQNGLKLNTDVWAVTPDAVVKDMKYPGGGTMSATYQFNRMIELMKKQNELLELISKKLAFVVEQLS